MDHIPFLTKSNFYEIVDRIDYSNREEILEILSNMIDYAPFMSHVISKFIVECIQNNSQYEQDIKGLVFGDTEDQEVALSRCIYATYLGAQTNLSQIQQISQTFSNLTLECKEVEKYQNIIENFYCSSILRRLAFNKKECVIRLSVLPFESVIYAIQEDQSFFNISLVVQMCRYLGFLTELAKHIHSFDKKDEIIAAIFINFFSDKSIYAHGSNEEALDTEKEILSQLITEETLEYCLKVANRKYLGLLLQKNFKQKTQDRISHDEFKARKFNDKKEFFEGFLSLASPSVTHFLSYLELYKDKFILDGDDQSLFCKMIREFHKDNPGYIGIVFSKLLKFKIVENKCL